MIQREREKENVRVREKERAGRLTESEIERPRVVGNMYEFVFGSIHATIICI